MAAGQAADSLEHYTGVALRDNPAVKAARLAHEAAFQRVGAAGAFEDPVLEAGFFLKPMEYVDGRQRAQLQLMQMFPWFGTRRAAREEMGHMAAMTREEYRETVDNLRAEIATRWYALCLLHRRWRDNEENRLILEQLERLALQRFSAAGGGGAAASPPPARADDAAPAATPTAGMAGMKMGGASPGTAGAAGAMPGMGGSSASPGMAGILRLRVELVGARVESESLLSELVAAKAAFNALLDRPPAGEVVLPDTCALLPFRLDVEEAARLILARNPMLGMLREEALARKAAGDMARKMSYPMLGIGLQYMLFEKNPASTGMNMGDEPPAMNGKDMVMPMFSVSIPIHRGKYRAARAEAVLLRRASEERHAATLRQLEAELYRYRHDLDDAARKVALYREQAALARAALDIGTGEFAAGRGALDDLLRVRQQLLEYGLREAAAIADYNTAVINVRRLVSFPDTTTGQNH
jgi:outer membrane protein TolC